jgi:hypothetical protein
MTGQALEGLLYQALRCAAPGFKDEIGAQQRAAPSPHWPAFTEWIGRRVASAVAPPRLAAAARHRSQPRRARIVQPHELARQVELPRPVVSLEAIAP